MKRLFLIIALIASALVQEGYSQEKPASVLDLYYNIKDALVSGNSSAAALKAAEFSKLVSDADLKVLSEDSKKALSKDAKEILASKDIKQQRNAFASLSDDIILLVKAKKLGTEPAYEVYCPMKKSNWLSKENTVKNPYYGAAMLTCGKVIGKL